MEWLPDNPFVPIVLACVLAAVAFSLLAFLIKSDFVASAAPPAIFLIGYYATYQKVPPFPPIGSTNKIFYIALLATLGGFVLDRIAVGPLPAPRRAWLYRSSPRRGSRTRAWIRRTPN